jgi:hypothetical protein
LENLKEKAAARVSSTLEWLPTTCPARRGKGKHGTKENMAEKDAIGSTVVSIDGLTLQDSPRDFVQCREHLADNTKLKCQLAECVQNYEKIKGECEKLSDRLGSDGVVPNDFARYQRLLWILAWIHENEPALGGWSTCWNVVIFSTRSSVNIYRLLTLGDRKRHSRRTSK